MLPFTIEQFFDLFEAYNLATYPAHWILLALTLTAVCLTFYRNETVAGRAIAAILGILWLWTGGVYHLQFFTEINLAAYLFGLMFVAQALIFAVEGAFAGRMRFRISLNSSGVAGTLMIIYALVVYPLVGYAFGHIYPRAPTFGTPCPTTMFTFGMLFFLDRRPPIYLYAIPVLWALIGTTAAYLFGIYEDLGLLIGAIALTLALIRKTSE